jgi:type IX secretion system PorP/SprF family membrane protein
MRSKYKFILLLAGLITTIKAMPQSDISMATNCYNRANYNPATITRDDYLYLFSNIRKQWIGVDGSPTTVNIQASQYFQEQKSALGFSMVADKIGVVQSLNPMATYAFRVNTNRYSWLSMGLSAGIFYRSVNTSLYEAEIINDPTINYDVETVLRPDLNIGFEYQTSHFIFSLSSTHLLSIGKQNTLLMNSNHRYCGINYKNTDLLLFNYNVGLQMVNRQNIFIVEGSTCIRIKHQTGLMSGPREIVELGATFRISRQLTLLAGIYINPDCKVGYVYNESLINSYYPNSTHEIVLEFRIPCRSAYSKNSRGRGFWYN